MPKKILIVDDDRGVHEDLTALLEPLGYELAHAFNGLEGLSAFRLEAPDLIVSDLMMLLMDGSTFATEVRKTNATIPIIMFFVLVTDEVRNVFIRTGVNEVLDKIDGPEILIAAVTKLLNPKTA